MWELPILMCTFARWKLIDAYSVFNVCCFRETAGTHRD